MAWVRDGAAWTQLRRLFGRGPVAGLTEAELLDRYAAGRDESAFEALVSLHGAMVLGVCRRTLDDPEDVEDAFQATFLVLVRRAGSLGPGAAVGPWLYGVACRVAMRSRSVAARRRSRERTIAGGLDVAGPEAAAMDDAREIAAALDRELVGLPANYRAAVVLCDLEGRPLAEAARQLGWPIGTVKGRLARAREMLRGRLARRGLVPSAAGLMAFLEGEAGATVPAGWVAITIDAARRAAAGEAAAGTVSAAATALAEGVLRTMKFHQWKSAAAALVAALVVAAGAGAFARGQGRAEQRPPVPDRRFSPPEAEQKVSGPQPATSPTGRTAGDLSPDRGEAPASPGDEPKPPSPVRTLSSEELTRAILTQLDDRLTMSFPQETPLEDILKYIKSSTQNEKMGLPSGIPIYVDPIGLQEAEKSLQSPVTLDLEGVALGRCLHLMLKQLGLDYFIEDGLMIITSLEANSPEDYRPKPNPPKMTPLMEMQGKAERGELSADQRKEFIQMLKDLKEIDALLHDPEYGKPSARKGEMPKAQRSVQ